MTRALLFICSFFLLVAKLLLATPEQRNVVMHYSEPVLMEQRKQLTLKMAQYLEKNPGIVSNATLDSPSILNQTIHSQSLSQPLVLLFQGEHTSFQTLDEYHAWLFQKVSSDPIAFLNFLELKDQPEIYLSTLKKVHEISHEPEVTAVLKEKYLEAAKNYAVMKDGHHQQLMQNALQEYLDLEEDRALGKQMADEILKISNTQ